MKGKGDHTGVVENLDDPCDVLAAELRSGQYSDTQLLDSGCTYQMCPKRVVQHIHDCLRSINSYGKRFRMSGRLYWQCEDIDACWVGEGNLKCLAVAVEKGDTTWLWYMHLGHMSERGLQVLHGNGVLPSIKK